MGRVRTKMENDLVLRGLSPATTHRQHVQRMVREVVDARAPGVVAGSRVDLPAAGWPSMRPTHSTSAADVGAALLVRAIAAILETIALEVTRARVFSVRANVVLAADFVFSLGAVIKPVTCVALRELGAV